MKKILSIDGGGIRGIIPAKVLIELEKRTGKPICRLFDYIAGTSTGGILAVGLVCPADGQMLLPRYSALDLERLYVKEGANIFHRTVWHKIEALGNLTGPRYDGSGAEEVLGRYFKGWYLKQALTRTLVTAYEIESRTPYFFKSWEAATDMCKDYLLRDVARATSAAPTFFPPVKVASHSVGMKVFVDGGVFANNPAMCAIAEVKKLHPTEEIMLVSLGTGNADRPISYESARTWGLAAWAEPLVDILIDGVSDTVDYQAELMVGADNYYRFQTDLPREIQEMDDSHPKTIELLEAWADRMISSKEEVLDAICKRLVSPLFPVDTAA